jgi:O-antigen/teichoic acid export membrane protein
MPDRAVILKAPMSTETPKRQLSVNFAINVAGAIAPIIIALVTVPILVRHIGDARYGVMSIVWVLLGYLGFLDLGLSRASTNALSRLPFTATQERSEIVATSFLLNMALAAIGAVLLYFAGHFLLLTVFTVPPDLEGEITAALPFIACLLPLALVSGFSIGILESRERFLLANSLQIGGMIVGQVVPVVCAILIAPSLSVIIPAAALSRAAAVIVATLIALYTEQGFRFDRFRLTKVRSLMNYGGWITLSSIILPVLNTLDQIVIGKTLGVSAVTYYSVPMNLVMRSQVFTSSLARTLFPRLSSLPRDEAIAISERAMMVSGILYGGLCAAGIFLMRPFLDLWMGPPFTTLAGTVAIVLLVGSWPNALTFAPYTLLQGQGRPDITAKLHAAQMVPYVLLLLLLTHTFGILGAAMAFVCRGYADCSMLILFSHMPRRIFRALLPSAVLVISASILQFALAGSTVALAAAACLAFALSIVLLRLQERAVFDETLAVAAGGLARWRGRPPHAFPDAAARPQEEQGA